MKNKENNITNSEPGHILTAINLSDGMPEFVRPYNHAPFELTQFSPFTHYDRKKCA